MKKKGVVLVLISFIAFSCFSKNVFANSDKNDYPQDNKSTVSQEDDTSDKTDKAKEENIKYYTYSNYAMNYRVDLPKSLEGKILNASSGSLLVNFNRGTYFKVSTKDIYKELDTKVDRSEINMDSSLIKDTYANSKFMSEYMNTELSKRSRNRNFVFNEIDLNGIRAFSTDYDVCEIDYELDNTGNEVEKITKIGEGCIYKFVYNGYIYTITTENNKGALSDYPQFERAVSSFEIKKSSILPYILVALACILICIFLIRLYVNRQGTSYQVVVEEAVRDESLDNLSEDKDIANAFKEKLIFYLSSDKEDFEWSNTDYSVERLYEWAQDVCDEIEAKEPLVKRINIFKSKLKPNIEYLGSMNELDVDKLNKENKETLYVFLKKFILEKKAEINEKRELLSKQKEEEKALSVDSDSGEALPGDISLNMSEQSEEKVLSVDDDKDEALTDDTSLNNDVHSEKPDSDIIDVDFTKKEDIIKQDEEIIEKEAAIALNDDTHINDKDENSSDDDEEK